MRIIMSLVSYVLASFAVALAWATVASLWNARGEGLAEFGKVLVTIFGLVTVTAALPFVIVYSLVRAFYPVTATRAAIGGFVLGASLYVLFLSAWISGPVLIGIAELVALGGGLGLLGGLVFNATQSRLLQFVEGK